MGFRESLRKRLQSPRSGPPSTPPSERPPHQSKLESCRTDFAPVPVSPLSHEDSSVSLWDRAYDALRESDRELVERYEKLLSREIQITDADRTSEAGGRLGDSSGPLRREQLQMITKRGLQRLEDRKLKYTIAGHEFVVGTQIDQAAKLVLWAKDWISLATKDSPEASVAWAGISLVLPLLTNPKTAEDANNEGFTYMTTRMRYYAAFETMVRKLAGNESVGGSSVAEVNSSIVDLYEQILAFHLKSVLRFYYGRLQRLGRDIVRYDDWEEQQRKIRSLEATVHQNLGQINNFASRQELERLNVTSAKSLEELQGCLFTQKEHLRVAEQSLEFQREWRQTDEERQCHQLFRLSADNRDVSYEWYKNRVPERVEGTCEWFLRHENFKQWLAPDSGSGPLLVSADPGCGKSVLARYLIDHVLPSFGRVCYFFFKDQDQNTAAQALCALLHQLFSHEPRLICHATSRYMQDGQGLVRNTQGLWEILENAVQDPVAGSVILVLDALDECEETEFRDLAQRLEALHLRIQGQISDRGGKLRSLLTCRPYESIVNEFQGLVEDFPYIRIPGEEDLDAISEEVNRVVVHRVQELSLEKRLSENVKKRLQEKLLEVENRTYLWVYLVFDFLRFGFKKTEKGVEDSIATLPENVNQAYERILSKSHNDPMVRKVLSIVLAAKVPLSVAEMNVVVNVDSSVREPSDMGLEEENDFRARLRDWCGLFISIYNGKVYFLHQTAREFLLAHTEPSSGSLPESRWYRSITTRSAHYALAEVCVIYLDLINSSEAGLEGRIGDLMDYSARFWSDHFCEAVVSGPVSLLDAVLRICDKKRRALHVWYNPGRGWGLPPRDADPLHLASAFGHPAVARLLLDRKADLELGDSEQGQTPLSWAVTNGNKAVVELLLSRGACLEAKDDEGRTPLIWATVIGDDEAVVELLLHRGAYLEAKDDEGRTPLIWAAAIGDKAVVELLLNGGAFLEAKDDRGRTPLIWAAAIGNEAVVELLLNRGAYLEAKDDEGWTPLICAAVAGDRAGFDLLLKREAYLEARDAYFGKNKTRLKYATEGSGVDAIEVLLDRGADVGARDGKSRTPLHWASENGYEYAVELLLNRAADPEVRDKDQQTPFMLALKRGHRAVVRLLREKGAVEVIEPGAEGVGSDT